MKTPTLFVVFVGASAAVPALGEVIGPAIRIEARASDGAWGFLEVSTDVSDWQNGVWNWWTDADQFIYDVNDPGRVLAKVDRMNMTYISDPQINLGFLVNAGAVDTTFTITSGLLSYAAMNSEARASAGVTLTEQDGNAGGLTGLHPGAKAYQARYNGGFPGGTVFASLVDSFGVPLFTTDTRNESSPNSGFTPIGVTSSMAAQFHFTLSANDAASGTSTYVIIPAPGGFIILSLAGLLAGVRRR